MGILSLVRSKCRSLETRIEKSGYSLSTFPDYLRRCGMQIGNDCSIASMHMEVGIEPYLIKIGNRVVIEAQVALMTHDGAAWLFRHQVPDLQVYGPVVIEDDCRIGLGAIICPNVRVGRGSLVAPGSVVISDVPAGTIVMGVPARSMGPVLSEPHLSDEAASGRALVNS